MTRVKVRLIDDPAVWAVVNSPVRHEIVETMRDVAPCGIKAIADRMGVAPDTLYRHVELLAEAGFVVAAGFRKAARGNEQLFDLTADDFHINFDTDSAPGPANDMIRDTASLFLKRLELSVKRTAAARGFNVSPAGKNVALLCEYVNLTREEYLHLAKLLRATKEFLDAAHGRVPPPPGTQLYNVLLAAIPVTMRARRKSKKQQPEKPPHARQHKSAGK